MNNVQKRYFTAFVLLIILFVAAFFANIFIGSTSISPADSVRAFFGKNIENVSDILWKIRIPRALAASGFVRSVSSGFMIIAAFAGSMISLGFVLIVSRKMKQMSMLVVCGIMIGYICSAITDFIVTFADDSDIVNLHDWSRGTFSGTNMDNVKIIAVITAAGIIGTLLISKPMGAYMLGENYAKNVGVNIKLLKVFLVILSGLFSACVTAFAGPVSFVGIAVPHIARMIFKTSKPLVIIPACFLSGSIFCMLCDMIARTVLSPTELSISIVTAVFGAPVVIVIMIRRKRGELQ